MLYEVITMHPPEIKPARAPFLVILFQYSESNITGPNAPPNPAHAYETKIITLLLGTIAK